MIMFQPLIFRGVYFFSINLLHQVSSFEYHDFQHLPHRISVSRSVVRVSYTTAVRACFSKKPCWISCLPPNLTVNNTWNANNWTSPCKKKFSETIVVSFTPVFGGFQGSTPLYFDSFFHKIHPHLANMWNQAVFLKDSTSLRLVIHYQVFVRMGRSFFWYLLPLSPTLEDSFHILILKDPLFHLQVLQLWSIFCTDRVSIFVGLSKKSWKEVYI